MRLYPRKEEKHGILEPVATLVSTDFDCLAQNVFCVKLTFYFHARSKSVSKLVCQFRKTQKLDKKMNKRKRFVITASFI